MTGPKLAKRYKVFWTYYISTVRTHHKLFEHLDKKGAEAWVKKLITHPITSSVQVTDYEGNYKVFQSETTMELLRKRERFFDTLTEAFGGGEEGKEKATRYLRKQGDWALTALPVQVRAFILMMKKKKCQDRKEKLNEERR